MDSDPNPFTVFPADACPFLAMPGKYDTALCLSRTDTQIAISPQYAHAVCLARDHTNCHLFVNANRTVRERLSSSVGSFAAGESDSREVIQPGQEGEPLELDKASPGPAADTSGPSDPSVVESAAGGPAAEESSTALKPTIASVHDQSRSDGRVTLSGTAAPNSRVDMYDGSERIGTTMADDGGNWTKTLRSVTPGVFLFRVGATDRTGNSLGMSDAHALSVPLRAGSAAPGRSPRHSFWTALTPLGRSLLRISAVVFLLIAGVLVLSVLSGLHSARPQLIAQPATVPGVHEPRSAVLWRFPALAASPKQVTLMVSNPNIFSVDAYVRVEGGQSPLRHVRVAPGSAVAIQVPRPQAAGTLTVQASGPVAVQRLIGGQAAAGSPAGRPSTGLSPAARPSPTPSPSSPSPARLWRFAALTIPVDHVSLLLTNKTRAPVTAYVHSRTPKGTLLRQVDILPGSRAKLELDLRSAREPLVVNATGPIVAARMVVQHSKSRTAYGTS